MLLLPHRVYGLLSRFIRTTFPFNFVMSLFRPRTSFTDFNLVNWVLGSEGGIDWLVFICAIILISLRRSFWRSVFYCNANSTPYFLFLRVLFKHFKFNCKKYFSTSGIYWTIGAVEKPYKGIRASECGGVEVTFFVIGLS